MNDEILLFIGAMILAFIGGLFIGLTICEAKQIKLLRQKMAEMDKEEAEVNERINLMRGCNGKKA